MLISVNLVNSEVNMLKPPNPAKSGDTIVLLGKAYSQLGHRLVQALVGEGFPQRPAHSGVMAHIDEGGTRPSVLARRANITPQAMGELVDDVERLGYVTREPDPNDRRAKLVVLTPRGIELEKVAGQQIASIDAQLTELLGETALQQLQQSLHAIINHGNHKKSQ